MKKMVNISDDLTTQRTKANIALVNMPFASHYVPSIGLSLLKSSLDKYGMISDILYLNLDYGEWCDPELYRALSL